MSTESKREWIESAYKMLKEGGIDRDRKIIAKEMFYQYEGMTPTEAIAEELPYTSN